MTSKLVTVFLLLALVALVVVNAQNNSTSTNEIDACIKRENCGTNERCRAACAGVPAPSKKVANDTVECYEDCAKKYANDTKQYTVCTNNCKVDVYQEGITKPGSPVPSGSQPKQGDEASSDNKTSSDSKDDDGDDDSEDKDDDKKDDSGASLSSKSALVYVFAAALACAAFSAGL